MCQEIACHYAAGVGARQVPPISPPQVATYDQFKQLHGTLEAEDACFFSPNQRSRGRVLNRTPPHSAPPLALTRCSQYAAQCHSLTTVRTRHGTVTVLY